VRLIAAAALALGLALAGCGGDDGEDVGASPSEILSEAATALDAQSTLAFSFEYVRTRADRSDEHERYGAGKGALDLAAGRGRLRFQLDLGLPSTASPTVDEPFEVRWDERSVEIGLHGEPRRLTRERARRSDDRAPGARPRRTARAERRAGRGSGGRSRLRGRRRRRGAPRGPAELTGAATSGLIGERLEVEAWINEERLTRRILVTIALEPVRSGGKLVLPARTVRVTYDLGSYGEPVTGLEFESQAG